jgi:inhibitor of cysteine peptidase
MELTERDSGARRTVRVGEHVTVVLPENPSTGYRWHADIDPAVLAQQADRYEGGREAIGAGGTRRLTFTTLRSGSTQLRLEKRRSWSREAIDAFEVQLDVDD